MGVKGYFIQYKFILPENTKHSSYTYQKLFRAIYGYTQAVFKSNGKNYQYHREGVLSKFPFIRAGKSCVIIPPDAFQELTDFFKTGKNPTHKWQTKGDWKAVYYLNEKDVSEKEAVSALEALLDRTKILSGDTPARVESALVGSGDPAIKTIAVETARKLTGNVWFKELYPKSERLKSFYTAAKTP
ncbi:MAG: hypothetical protein HY394_00010 [Candidatus Diapherotrites archaeon]|nr:hypothetical protein [Candidatus Diapherotrites archaeon]